MKRRAALVLLALVFIAGGMAAAYQVGRARGGREAALWATDYLLKR